MNNKKTRTTAPLYTSGDILPCLCKHQCSVTVFIFSSPSRRPTGSCFPPFDPKSSLTDKQMSKTETPPPPPSELAETLESVVAYNTELKQQLDTANEKLADLTSMTRSLVEQVREEIDSMCYHITARGLLDPNQEVKFNRTGRKTRLSHTEMAYRKSCKRFYPDTMQDGPCQDPYIKLTRSAPDLKYFKHTHHIISSALSYLSTLSYTSLTKLDGLDAKEQEAVFKKMKIDSADTGSVKRLVGVDLPNQIFEAKVVNKDGEEELGSLYIRDDKEAGVKRITRIFKK